MSTRTPGDRLARLVTRGALCAALITGGVAALIAAPHAMPAMVLVDDGSGGPAGDGWGSEPSDPPEQDGSTQPAPSQPSGHGRARPTPPPSSGPAATPTGHSVAPKVVPPAAAAVPAPRAADSRPAPVAPPGDAAAANQLGPAPEATDIGPATVAGAGTAPSGPVTTTVTPVRQNAGSAVASGGSPLGTLSAVAGSLVLLGVALAWRLRRPRRPIPVAGTSLYQTWKSDLDELADLAVLTTDPAERGEARARRRRFSSEPLARRLSSFGDRPV